MPHRFCLAILLVSVCTFGSIFAAEPESTQTRTIARCGAGWLEEIDGYPVLHLKGTWYEMGYQHGALLKESVRKNLGNLVDRNIDKKVANLGPIPLKPRFAVESIIGMQTKHVPAWYEQELRGLAAGSGVPLPEIKVANFVPELFHCSGFALMNSATKDGILLHGRVLDYAIGWGLQEHAVIIVAEPDDGIPFVNVSYAGFIGSVTGMNAQQVAIGEMGGRGLGHWDGVPMAILVREVLQQAKTLDEALSVFRDQPRTCQYYYVISDAKTNEAVGLEASWNRFEAIKPGTAHELLPSPVKDAVLLSAGSRYELLVERAKAGHGAFTAEKAMRLMDRPVSMKSNLHNALFEPASGRFWVANATPDKQPAAEQPYSAFNLKTLLNRQPNPNAKQLPSASEMRGDVAKAAGR